jgi:hypothetical protein
MSYRERQNRKNRKGMTPAELRKRNRDLYPEPGQLDRLRPLFTLGIRPDGSREILAVWEDPGMVSEDS